METQREIKFRAWDNIEKKWLFISEQPNLGGFYLVGETVLGGELNRIKLDKLLHDIVFTQFTGLTDKNGKEIYANDFIKAEDGTIIRIYHVTTDMKQSDILITTPLSDAQNQSWISTSCEVCGNIYQNPELISQ